MTYNIEFTTASARQIRKLPRGVRSRVIDGIADLGDDPRPRGSKKLVGEHNAWSIRIGEFRVIYEVLDTELVITVIRVANRRDVYRP